MLSFDDASAKSTPVPAKPPTPAPRPQPLPAQNKPPVMMTQLGNLSDYFPDLKQELQEIRERAENIERVQNRRWKLKRQQPKMLRRRLAAFRVGSRF